MRSFLSHAWLLLPLLIGAKNLAADPLRIGSFVPIPSVQAYENLIAASYCRVGVSINFVRLPFKRSLLEANVGMLDGNLMRFQMVEKNALNLVRVPEPLPPLQLAYLAIKPLPQEVTGETEILYRAGYFAGLSLFDSQRWKPASIGVNGSYDQLVSLLKADRIDFMVAGYWDTELLLKQYPQLQLVGRRQVELPMYHYVHRQHAGLVEKLTTALTDLKANGRIYELMARGARQVQTVGGSGGISQREIDCKELLDTSP